MLCHVNTSLFWDGSAGPFFHWLPALSASPPHFPFSCRMKINFRFGFRKARYSNMRSKFQSILEGWGAFGGVVRVLWSRVWMSALWYVTAFSASMDRQPTHGSCVTQSCVCCSPQGGRAKSLSVEFEPHLSRRMEPNTRPPCKNVFN